MKNFYKRLLCFILLPCMAFCPACKNNGDQAENLPSLSPVRLSVNFIDVGEGDAIFLSFPDGKNMLIDTGENSSQARKAVFDFLGDNSVKRIDYMVLTHPDTDHIGNAKAIVQSLTVGKMYIPYIINSNLFPTFKDVLQEYNGEKVISKMFNYILGENYFLAFLLPKEENAINGAYGKLNAKQSPTADDINGVSCVIYLECFGKRFLFMGDATKETEEELVFNNQAGLYNAFFSAINKSVNLDGIDFLKVAHHGASDASSAKFLNLVKPQNAVISVGGSNTFGHPDTYALYRILQSNPTADILRTDIYGNISVNVYENQFEIITELN